MADPKTCLHNVVEAYTQEGTDYVVCGSCKTEITAAMWLKKNYRFDRDYRVFVHDAKPPVDPLNRLELVVVTDDNIDEVAARAGWTPESVERNHRDAQAVNCVMHVVFGGRHPRWSLGHRVGQLP